MLKNSCTRHICEPYICGFYLFKRDNVDAERLEELKMKIALLQSKGAFVKLAVGGQQWGNTFVKAKVWYQFSVLFLLIFLKTICSCMGYSFILSYF